MIQVQTNNNNIRDLVSAINRGVPAGKGKDKKRVVIKDDLQLMSFIMHWAEDRARGIHDKREAAAKEAAKAEVEKKSA